MEVILNWRAFGSVRYGLFLSWILISTPQLPPRLYVLYWRNQVLNRQVLRDLHLLTVASAGMKGF